MVRQQISDISSVQTDERHTKVTPENIARMWHIGLDTAKKVFDITTQHGVRTALHPLQRRYRADHLHMNRLRLQTTFYTDTLFLKVRSLNGMTCAQIYTDGNCPFVFPMASKKDVGQTQTDLADDFGYS